MGQCRCHAGFTGLDCSGTAGGSTLNSITENIQALAKQPAAPASNSSAPRFRALTNAELLGRSQSNLETSTRAQSSVVSAAAAGASMRMRSLAMAGPCPNGCSSKGICREGTCFCDPGQTGPDCSQGALLVSTTRVACLALRLPHSLLGCRSPY